MRACEKKDLSFIFSLQKGSKRAWSPLGYPRMHASLLKHSERLSSFHGFLPLDLDDNIRRTSYEVFQSIIPDGTVKPEPTKFVPSGSACLQASVNDGGCLSLFEPLDTDSIFEDKERLKIGKLRLLDLELNRWRKKSYLEAKKIVEKVVREDCGDGLFDLQVVPIAEPSKYRIITKGNGYLYSVLQPLQGLMIDAWKSHRSSTMLHEDLTTRVNEIYSNVKFADYWCSVDYEAATDLIKKEATLSAFRSLEGTTNFELAWQALSASGNISYPSFRKINKQFNLDLKDIPNVDLYDGQLMGHPLSFPLLCVINLSVYRTAIDRWVKSAPNNFERRCRKDRGRQMWENVIVNGDDMLFRCEFEFYDIFVQCAKDAGLLMSVGKQYLSKDMCMINSQVFKKNGNKMVKCSYLNQKFFFDDLSKMPHDPDYCQPDQFGKDINKMIEHCSWTKCAIPRIFSRFKIKYQSDFRPNWYLPYHLGGFGVDIKYSPEDWKVTRQQRKVARLFLNDPKELLFRHKSILRDKLTKKISGGLCNFRFEQPYRPLNQHETKDSDPWLQRLCLIKRVASGGELPSEKGFHYVEKQLQGLRPIKFAKFLAVWTLDLVGTMGPLVGALNPLY